MAVELTHTLDLGSVLTTCSSKSTRPGVTHSEVTLLLRHVCALGLPGATVLSTAGEGAPGGGQHQQHQPEGEPGPGAARGHDGGGRGGGEEQRMNETQTHRLRERAESRGTEPGVRA